MKTDRGWCCRASIAHSKMAAVTLLTSLLLAGGLQARESILEEVIVSTQKRVENVQDIPLTINVIAGNVLDQFNIRDTNDLAASVPGLTIQHTPQNLSQVAIRGLGTGAGGDSLDQSVGLFIDGIWAGRIREFQTSLFDVERIEVIKGTQTSLLGKNTSLGAVSVISRKPGETLGGYLQVDYEFEFESILGAGAIDIPTGFGNYRLAFNAVAEGGYVSNLATGNEVPERHQNTLRGSGEWAVGNKGNLLLMVQYDELEITGDTFQPLTDLVGFIALLDPNANIGLDQTKNTFTSELGGGGDAFDEQRSQRAVIQYDHAFGDYALTSLTGWSKFDNSRFTDSDFLAVDFLNTLTDSKYRQLSQELRIASPTDSQFVYVAGLYYLDSKQKLNAITDASFPPPFTLEGLPIDSTTSGPYEQDTEVWSLFGQGSFSFADNWSVTLGLRYTDEQKDGLFATVRLRSGGPLADIVANLLAPEIPATPLSRSEDNLDGSINIQYDINAELMAFASWARGSKSGGFDTQVALPEDAEYETEVAETTELGIKTNLAGGAAILNASLFYTKLDDFQVTSFVRTVFLTQTVPAKSVGLELESQWAIATGLAIGASATYAKAEQKQTGFQLPYAPEWSASLSLSYEHPWTSANLLWRVNGLLNYRDEQYQQADERDLDDALTLFNLRVALLPADAKWEVALVGRNLLDDESSFTFDYPFFSPSDDVPLGSSTIGSLNRPRTVAIQGRYNF